MCLVFLVMFPASQIDLGHITPNFAIKGLYIPTNFGELPSMCTELFTAAAAFVLKKRTFEAKTHVRDRIKKTNDTFKYSTFEKYQDANVH
jgi:hypothetical protein